VIISHRVRAVQHCDEILVLEGGRATARGTHEALMAQGGYYARVAQEQQREAAQRASRDAGGVS
jgi:ABC-type multidrug transport system fused ATPase/permease subunit